MKRMLLLICLTALLCVSGLGSNGPAAGFVFKSINYPGALATVALGINVMNTGEIEGSLSNFSASSYVLRAAWARSLSSNFTVGAGAKILRESIEKFSSSGGALDAGVLYTPIRGLTLGFAAMNIGMVSAFEEERDSLPMTF